MVLTIASAVYGSITAAAATTKGLDAPSDVHVTTIGQTSFTVSAAKANGATGYGLLVSTAKADLDDAALTTPTPSRTTVTATRPKITVSGLTYSRVTYWFRYETMAGSRSVVDPTIHSVRLAPSAPADVQVVSGATGFYLSWDDRDPVTAFGIAQSTSSTMLADRETYSIGGQNTRFTPYGLTPGVTYYFRLWAVNRSTTSAYSAEVSGAPSTSMRAVRVMTWNALNLNLDGHVENGTVVASWNSARKPAAAALIGPAQPDVLAVQEAGASTDGRGSSRQVDSLAQALGSDYTVAQTEIAPGHKGYAPTGNYIIYRSGEFTALNKVGATTTRGHWAIGDSMSAAYQVLRDDSTNASFLMVSVHLNSSEPSTERASEASTIVSHAGALGTQLGLPIVYAGDFDSFYASYSPDLPGAAMRASGVDEALFLATSVTDANYRTVNGYRLTPPTGKVEVDRVWVSPGVGVQTWGQLLDLAADGQFSGTIPSDHNPSYADLMIPYPGVSTSAE